MVFRLNLNWGKVLKQTVLQQHICSEEVTETHTFRNGYQRMGYRYCYNESWRKIHSLYSVRLRIRNSRKVLIFTLQHSFFRALCSFLSVICNTQNNDLDLLYSPPNIPPNVDLKFEIELLHIEKVCSFLLFFTPGLMYRVFCLGT